jgi:cell division septum initiation protein DivIVA
VLAEDRPAYGHRIDLLTLVDQLQEVVETSSHIPLSDRIVVSSDLLLDLVDAIRNTIPHDVIEAERVLQERHRLLEESREEADHVLESARDQSKFMLQDHHIVKAAELKAERILNQAQREADEVMESADEYVQKLFSQFEDEAVRLAAEIRRVAARRS